MKLEPFFLERYFAKHVFSAKYLLSSSDCEAFYMQELLESADAQSVRLWEKLKLGIIQGHRAQHTYQQETGHILLCSLCANVPYSSMTTLITKRQRTKRTSGQPATRAFPRRVLSCRTDSIHLMAVCSPQLQFYLSLPSLTISTISCVVIFALIVGTSKGEEAVFSGTRAKVLPSFLRISTFPVLSAFSRTKASFCRASEYV